MEEKTSRGTAFSVIASSSTLVPYTLVRQYSDGLATDSPTRDFAAKCSTASKPPPAEHVGRRW